MEACGNQTGRSRHLDAIFAKGNVLFVQGILEHEIRGPPGLLGEKSEAWGSQKVGLRSSRGSSRIVEDGWLIST